MLLQATGRHAEAEPLYRRSLAIYERSYGPHHPDVAADLNNLAVLLRATGRHAEAEPLYRRGLAILDGFQTQTGYQHPNFQTGLGNYVGLLEAMGWTPEQVADAIGAVFSNPARPASLMTGPARPTGSSMAGVRVRLREWLPAGIVPQRGDPGLR